MSEHVTRKTLPSAVAHFASGQKEGEFEAKIIWAEGLY